MVDRRPGLIRYGDEEGARYNLLGVTDESEDVLSKLLLTFRRLVRQVACFSVLLGEVAQALFVRRVALP